MVSINMFGIHSKVISIIFLVEQQTESFHVIISSGVLSCGLDPFTGDEWQPKRAASTRSLCWHDVFICSRHGNIEPNESFKYSSWVTHLPYAPASRTDDARLRFQRLQVETTSGAFRSPARAPSVPSSNDEPRRIDFTVAIHPEKSVTQPSLITSKY